MPVLDIFVSVIAPLRDDAAIVSEYVADVIEVLRRNFANYELILVDDGSKDGTAEAVEAALGRYECIRLLRLSRAFGEEIAITAGLDSAIGDYAVIMLPKSDPPALIPEFVRLARLGSGVVFGVRRTRRGESVFMRMGAAIWHWYSRRFLNLSLPRNSSQYRLLTRQAVNAVVRIRDKYRYLGVLSTDVGFPATAIEYDPIARNPRHSPRSFWERVAIAIDIVVANSPHPLRVATAIGLVASTLSFLFALTRLAIESGRGGPIGSWVVFTVVTFLFTVMFGVLSLLGEYLTHLLRESQDRPLYYVLGERNSAVDLADPERRNIVMSSVGDRA